MFDPDLDDALEEEVDPAAEEALAGAGDDADQARDRRDHQREEHRDAEAVDDARDHVAGLVVGAEPVVAVGRRGGGGDAVVDGVVAVGDRAARGSSRDARSAGRRRCRCARIPRRRASGSSRQASTPPVADQAAHLGGGVLRLGLRTRRRSRPRSRSAAPGSRSWPSKRTSSGRSFATNSAQSVTRKSDEEDPERPEGAAVGAEVREPAALERGEAHQVSRLSKSMRGSTQT